MILEIFREESAFLHPCLWLWLPSSPLSTPTWGLRAAFLFPVPTGLPSIQVSPDPVCSISTSPSGPLSLRLCLSFVFLSSPPCLPRSLAPSLFLLPRREGGGAGGGSSTLRPPWGLILRAARGERAGREGEKGREGREQAGATCVCACASVSECECRALPLLVPRRRGLLAWGERAGCLEAEA